MPKDSQIDPKEVRMRKNRRFMKSEADSGTKNAKKQSGSRRKPGSDQT